MPKFDTIFEKPAHHRTRCAQSRILFLIFLASISPKSCTGAPFAPRSRAQLKNALDNCARALPKCRCSFAGWDVSNVRDMSGMFQGATSFSGDISQWDVSRVGNMKDMFRNSGSFKHNLCGSSWVHSTAIKTGMFTGSSGSISKEVCASNRPASREVCTRTRPALAVSTSDFKFSSNEQLKLEVAEFLKRSPTGDCSDCPQGAIAEWDVSRVTDMSEVFLDAKKFNGDISKWDVSRVTKMSKMFMGASAFDGDVSKWNVSRVRDMSSMFAGAESFKGDISAWDVFNVEYMHGMFSGATAFNAIERACRNRERTLGGSIQKHRIVIGGGSGFVGQALADLLRKQRHDVIVISRNPAYGVYGDMTWDDIKRDGLPRFTDAVINLAGSDIMDFKRLWTCKYKEECVSSRVDTTALLAKAISESDNPPSVWISTSATGFYPPSKENEYDEGSRLDPKEADWAWKLCTDVEHAAKISDPEARTRSVIMRLGIVLGQGGGPFEKMRLPFYCCLGGTFGDGSQWFPYVHLKDVVRAFEFAVLDDRARGPLNVVAPSACTNKEFTKALGRAMRRPTFLSVPKFVYSLLGEERSSLLLTGRHVKPNALTLMGFEFNFPDVTSCCADLVNKKN